MNRVVLMCSSAIITGIFAMDMYREYKQSVYLIKINNLEKQCESLKKELESALVVKQVLEETDEIVNINELDLNNDIQDSEPSPYGSCDEDGDNEDNDEDKLFKSESENSVEELTVSYVLDDNENNENNEESTESV